MNDAIPFQQLCLGYARYEALRKLNPRQFQELWEKNIRYDIDFDVLVDELIKKNEFEKMFLPQPGV
jgi:transcription elongation factor GreA-like protein